MRNDGRVRHLIRNAGGVSNLQRRSVYVDREGKMIGCTEKRTKANQKMLNRMAERAEGFYWNTNTSPRPILEEREYKIVDLIINNHYGEIGTYADYLMRRRKQDPEKRVDPKFPVSYTHLRAHET